MSNLTPCEACQQPISRNAKTCPKCGEPVLKNSKYYGLGKVLLVLLVIIMAYGLYLRHAG